MQNYKVNTYDKIAYISTNLDSLNLSFKYNQSQAIICEVHIE